MFKKILSIILILTLCGCSKVSEIEGTAIIVGAGIDLNGEEIELTAEVVNTEDAKEGNAKGKVFSCKASSFTEASEKLSSVIGKPLYWDHTKLIIISENSVEITDRLLEWLLRSPQTRIDIPLGICKGSARALLETEAQGSNFISDTFLGQIDASFQNGYTAKTKAYLVFNELFENNTSLLPYIEIKEDKPQVNGTVFLDGHEITAKLNPLQTQTALLLKGELKRGQIVLENSSFIITKAKVNSKGGILHADITLSLEEISHMENEEALTEKAKEELLGRCEDVAGLLYEKDIKLAPDLKIKSHGQERFSGGKDE